MLVVSRFDERYLWVDSLCIMQDDAENKHDQIALMDVIYQEAILTIVAVSGKNAGVGLPGVRAGSRNVLQYIEHIQGLVLVNSLTTPSDSVDRSLWNARAWTFQEGRLSRRVLFLADEKIPSSATMFLAGKTKLNQRFAHMKQSHVPGYYRGELTPERPAGSVPLGVQPHFGLTPYGRMLLQEILFVNCIHLLSDFV